MAHHPDINLVDDDPTLATVLTDMQGDLERELTTLGGMVERFRGLDAAEAEDLARNMLRAYDAVADVIRMVRTLRGVDPADTTTAGSARRAQPPGEVVEATAREFFAGDGDD